MKWLIDPEGPPQRNDERQQYWESVHADAEYGNVLSVTDDPRLRTRLAAETRGARRILVPGCGSRAQLEHSLLDEVSDVDEIVCTDFPAVVELAKSRLEDKRVHYVARDSTDLRFDSEFDAVVVVNSILSESDAENREILASCARALRPDGVFVGLFPSILANLDLAVLAGDNRLRSTVDVESSTKLELQQDAKQIFYTPLRLRVIVREAGLALERFEIVFLDAVEFRKPDQTYRELIYPDEDLVTYEYFVRARKLVPQTSALP